MTESYADIRPIGDFTSESLSTQGLKTIEVFSPEYLYTVIESIIYRTKISLYTYSYSLSGSIITVTRELNNKFFIKGSSTIKVHKVIKRYLYEI